MALLDPYATRTDYRDRVSDKSAGTDDVLDAQLLAGSRLLERSLQVAPGAFNTHTGTYLFDGSGSPVLRLRDSAGHGYFLQSATAIDVDISGDGTFSESLTLGTNVWGLPQNAAAFSEPYTALRRTAWPLQQVRIAGTFGWATVPGIIVDLTVHVTHDLRDAHLGGATLDMPTIDGSMPLSDQSWRLWREAKALFGRRLAPVA